MAVAVLFLSATTYAQKFAYVDMEYILGKMPTYTEAQKQLDKIAGDWQKEVETKNFHRRRGKENGSVYCKGCSTNQTLERMRKLKNQMVEYKGGCCVKCGYNKCYKMHNLTHQEYLERMPFISVYCDGCLDKEYNEFVKNKKLKNK